MPHFAVLAIPRIGHPSPHTCNWGKLEEVNWTAEKRMAFTIAEACPYPRISMVWPIPEKTGIQLSRAEKLAVKI